MKNMLKNMHLILLKVFLYLIQILSKYFKNSSLGRFLKILTILNLLIF